MPRSKSQRSNPPQESPLSPVQTEAADELAREADANPETESREERVRAAAYRRFEARGGSHGNDMQDWIDAEGEVDRTADRATRAKA